MRGRMPIWRGLAIGGLLLLAFWLAARVFEIGQKAEVAWQTARETKSAYEALETRKGVLQSQLNALSTPYGQDAAIRQAFGVARPGEEVIVLVPSASSTASSTPNFWQRIWNWF